jgi:putative ABC transport system permease protein
VPIASAALIVAGIAGIAAFVSNSAKAGGYFAGSLTASIFALSGVAWLLLSLLRLIMARARAIPVSVRHGLANLYRPGNHAQAALVALGVGVMFTLSVDLIQRSLLIQILNSAPPEMPNVFLINITEAERDGIAQLLKKQPGIEGSPELVPSISARLELVNGTPVEQLPFADGRRRFRNPRNFTTAREKPANVIIKQGAWWPADSPDRRISVEEDEASRLGLKLGSPIEWTATGLPGTAVVAAIHRFEGFRMGASYDFILNPAAAANMPTMYFGGVRMKAPQVAALQRAAYRAYPTVTVINAADVLQIVQSVVDQIALVIQFISAFSIVAGAIILAAGIAGTRFRRVRELVIFKTLGARRSRMAAIFSVEFLVLGLVAGMMGTLLANGFAALILKQLLEADYRFDLLPNAIAVVATPLIANAAGWLASWRILNQKPLEVLRHE